MVTEDVFDRLLAAKVLEIRLYPLDEENGEDAETLAINVSEDKVKTAFREHMTHHFLDKEVAEDILDGEGTVLAHKGDHFTAELIETILDNGTVKELSIRNNEVDGIYVEAITAGKNKSTVLESLRDRLVGRTLAEEIEDKDGHVLYHINDYITEDMADVIASLREKVKIRSVLTCKFPLWRLPQVLWTQPRHGPQGRNRRSCRDHCRPGHRGTGHPAHDAYVPYGRRCRC